MEGMLAVRFQINYTFNLQVGYFEINLNKIEYFHGLEVSVINEMI